MLPINIYFYFLTVIIHLNHLCSFDILFIFKFRIYIFLFKCKQYGAVGEFCRL